MDTNTDEFNKWYNRSLKLLSFRPRSTKEISDFLLRKKVAYPFISKITKKLTVDKLLDDYAFTEWFVENRTTFRPKSSHALKSELWQKGIEKGIVEEVLELKFGTQTEVEGAFKVAEKKWRLLRNLSPLEQKKKLSEYLWRKGYSHTVVQKTLTQLKDFHLTEGV